LASARARERGQRLTALKQYFFEKGRGRQHYSSFVRFGKVKPSVLPSAKTLPSLTHCAFSFLPPAPNSPFLIGLFFGLAGLRDTR